MSFGVLDSIIMGHTQISDKYERDKINKCLDAWTWSCPICLY